jgi:hypothetical protein
LCCNPGDALLGSRPDWATDGSFLAFRFLEQLVPEFNDFLIKHPIVDASLTRHEGSELQGYVLQTRPIPKFHSSFLGRGWSGGGNQVSRSHLAGF